MTRTMIGAAVATAAVAATLVAPNAAVAGDRDVNRSGRCTQFGRWELKVSPENRRRLEIEFEVDVNRRGQRYRVRVFHNGRRVKQVRRRTRGRSGSFTVRDLERNRVRRDRIRVRADRIGPSRQRCVGRIRL